MKTIEITENKTGDVYFYPICNISYFSYCQEQNHLFIMMADGRNRVTYKRDEFKYRIVEL